MNPGQIIMDLWDVVLALFMGILLVWFSYRLWRYSMENEARGWKDFSINFILTGVFLIVAEITVIIKYMALYASMETTSLALGSLSGILWIAAAYYAARGINEYLKIQREVFG